MSRSAEDLGYIHYTCRRHGGFWSDSGPCCPSCPDPGPAEEDEPSEETEDESK